MQTMNISLPDPMRDYVDQQISTGRYSSASEYIRELIRADERRRADEDLESKLLAGLSSPSEAFSSKDWLSIRQEALARIEQRRKGR